MRLLCRWELSDTDEIKFKFGLGLGGPRLHLGTLVSELSQIWFRSSLMQLIFGLGAVQQSPKLASKPPQSSDFDNCKSCWGPLERSRKAPEDAPAKALVFMAYALKRCRRAPSDRHGWRQSPSSMTLFAAGKVQAALGSGWQFSSMQLRVRVLGFWFRA